MTNSKGRSNSGRRHSQGAKASRNKSAPLQKTGLYRIASLSHDGRGIGVAAEQKHDAKKVFISGALPGELVSAQISQQHKNFDEAVLRFVEEPSEHRQAPFCSHYGECGGCRLQHLSDAKQLEHKADSAMTDMRGQWKVKVPKVVMPKLGLRRPHAKPPVKAVSVPTADNIEFIQSPSLAYRRRARLGISQDGQLGFRKLNSNDTLAISGCEVLTEPLQQILLVLNQWMALEPDRNWRRFIGHVEIIDAEPHPAIIVRRTADLGAAFESLKALAVNHSYLLAVVDEKGQIPTFVDLSDVGGGGAKTTTAYAVDGKTLEFPLNGFIQVNNFVNQDMVSKALEWLAPNSEMKVLDLFCGVGNFTIPVAARVGSISGVELDQDMVVQARLNAESNGIDNANFYVEDLELSANRAQWKSTAFDAVILDPPRAGAEGVLPFLIELSAPTVLYISCNYSSLIRDLKVLAQADYRLEKLAFMDMFPHTEHVECMALLKLTPKSSG